MPTNVHFDLSQVLISSDGVSRTRWVVLPITIRKIAAAEKWLRDRERDGELGGQLTSSPLRFLRAGGVVMDTGCLIGDLIEVVAVGSDEAATHRPTQEAADRAGVGKQSGRSGAGEQQPQTSQSDAAEAE